MPATCASQHGGFWDNVKGLCTRPKTSPLWSQLVNPSTPLFRGVAITVLTWISYTIKAKKLWSINAALGRLFWNRRHVPWLRYSIQFQTRHVHCNQYLKQTLFLNHPQSAEKQIECLKIIHKSSKGFEPEKHFTQSHVQSFKVLGNIDCRGIFEHVLVKVIELHYPPKRGISQHAWWLKSFATLLSLQRVLGICV